MGNEISIQIVDKYFELEVDFQARHSIRETMYVMRVNLLNKYQ